MISKETLKFREISSVFSVFLKNAFSLKSAIKKKCLAKFRKHF